MVYWLLGLVRSFWASFASSVLLLSTLTCDRIQSQGLANPNAPSSDDVIPLQHNFSCHKVRQIAWESHHCEALATAPFVHSDGVNPSSKWARLKYGVTYGTKRSFLNFGVTTKQVILNYSVTDGTNMLVSIKTAVSLQGFLSINPLDRVLKIRLLFWELVPLVQY